MMNEYRKRNKSNIYCCVPHCKTYYYNNVSFHQFPSDPKLKAQWIEALKLGKQISSFMRVCSKHFRNEDYFFNRSVTTKKYVLKKNTVPSQQLPGSCSEDSYLVKNRKWMLENTANLRPWKMTKKRKFSTNLSPIKVEVKEENILGNDYLMAKGRLKGVLKQLTEKSESDSESSDDNRSSKYRKRKGETVPTPYRHTYVMKLFDRSVDLARFEEDTPLYPICRAWMQNQPRNPQLIVKRRLSSPEPNDITWNTNNMISDIHRLPPPLGSIPGRIPSPLPEQLQQSKDNINLNYDECPPVPKDVLIRNHLQRWVKVKKKWIETAAKNEERYHMSTQILQTIYNKAQEAME